MAAIGMRSSSEALAATSARSATDEATAARGVRAPASKLGIERFKEPHAR